MRFGKNRGKNVLLVYWSVPPITSSTNFTNCCLRHILGIFWPNEINNSGLWDRTKQEIMNIQLRTEN